MKSYDIITIADMGVDLMVWGNDMEPDFGQKEKLLAGYAFELGGSCPIFACQCAKLGLKTGITGTVGRDFLGDLQMRRLKESGVNVSAVIIREDIPTGFGIAMCKGNRRAIFTFPGSFDATEFSQIPVKFLQDTRHIHIASYFILSKMRPYFSEIIKIAKEAGATISLDTNWDPEEKWDLADILPMVDVFLPNENELKAIMRDDDLISALKKASQITGLCVVKCGEKGALCFHEDTLLRWDTHDIPVVDSVGAGDTFDAGFLYGWLNDKPLYECGRIATFCSEGNITAPGGIAGQPHLDAMRAALYPEN